MLEALRLSANSYGLLVAADVHESTILAGLNGQPGGGSIQLEGELDRVVTAIARAEQQMLRAHLLGGAEVAEMRALRRGSNGDHFRRTSRQSRRSDSALNAK